MTPLTDVSNTQIVTQPKFNSNESSLDFLKIEKQTKIQSTTKQLGGVDLGGLLGVKLQIYKSQR